jgi:hypothetical protein
VIILEIVLGSEYVITCKGDESIRWLFYLSEPYIDTVLFEILEELLIEGKFVKATTFIEDNVHGKPDIIAENIRRM